MRPCRDGGRQEHGYSVIITTSNEDPETEYAEVEQMLQWHVDGLVAIPASFRHSRLTRTLFGKTPVVLFDRPVQDPALDVVLVQNTAGAHRMVEHLIEHGHQRIAFMGFSRDLFTINARFLGYGRTMLEAGFKVNAFFGCESQEDTLRAVEAKLHSPDAADGHLRIEHPGNAPCAGRSPAPRREDSRRSCTGQL